MLPDVKNKISPEVYQSILLDEISGRLEDIEKQLQMQRPVVYPPGIYPFSTMSLDLTSARTNFEIVIKHNIKHLCYHGNTLANITLRIDTILNESINIAQLKYITVYNNPQRIYLSHPAMPGQTLTLYFCRETPVEISNTNNDFQSIRVLTIPGKFVGAGETIGTAVNISSGPCLARIWIRIDTNNSILNSSKGVLNNGTPLSIQVAYVFYLPITSGESIDFSFNTQGIFWVSMTVDLVNAQ